MLVAMLFCLSAIGIAEAPSGAELAGCNYISGVASISPVSLPGTDYFSVTAFAHANTSGCDVAVVVFGQQPGTPWGLGHTPLFCMPDRIDVNSGNCESDLPMLIQGTNRTVPMVFDIQGFASDGTNFAVKKQCDMILYWNGTSTQYHSCTLG